MIWISTILFSFMKECFKKKKPVGEWSEKLMNKQCTVNIINENWKQKHEQIKHFNKNT